MTLKEFGEEFVSMGACFSHYDSEKKMNKWVVCIGLYSHKTNMKSHDEQFDYFTGTAIPTDNLDKADFLQSLQSDCRASEQSFVEFAEEFGYTNIREAEKVYKACKVNCAKMRRVMGPRWNQFLQLTEE